MRKEGKNAIFWSIVVPTCGRHDYLACTLRSALRAIEDSLPAEILVIDNASTSHAVSEALETLGTPMIRVLRFQEQVAMAQNWDRAVLSASGEWVHILHDDDMVTPNFYTKIEHAIKAAPRVGMIATSARFIDAGGSLLQGSNGCCVPDGVWTDFRRTAQERNPVVCPAVVVRRDVLRSVGPFRTDLKLTLDWEMWARIAQRNEVYGISEPLALYRQHATSASRSPEHQLAWCREIRDLIVELHLQHPHSKPGFGTMYSWGGAAVRAALRISKWRAFKTMFAVFRLKPTSFGVRWCLRQCVAIVRRDGR